MIVKADDLGLALAKNDGGSAVAGAGRALGRVLVRGMPAFLTFLSILGTAAMIWVGGGIILHGFELYASPGIGRGVKAAAESVVHALPSIAGVLEWMIEAAISAAVGLLSGAASILIIEFVFSPSWKLLMSYWQARQKSA